MVEILAKEYFFDGVLLVVNQLLWHFPQGEQFQEKWLVVCILYAICLGVII
jgi:hypothetical protein